MTTDLFGKPLSGYPNRALSLHQKRQAALLYHWMSLDYLKGLKTLLDALIQGADVRLELAKQQGRDAVLTNERWGVRDTAANWSTYAFPALEDFRRSVIKDIALRATESYEFTGANQCAHMLGEISSLWMTEEEESSFKTQWEMVSGYAQKIDAVVGVGGNKRLEDFSMTLEWQDNVSLFPKLPSFKVRTDVQAETGKRPPRTGVYVSQDDPHATLQFGWTGNSDGNLGPAQTFNDLGLKMLAAVGREAMWLDGKKMAAFAGPLFRQGLLSDRCGFDPGDEDDPEWVGAILSGQSFTDHPCKWYFVEVVNGEFDEEHDPSATTQRELIRSRCEAGQPCPREGFWFTPAQTNSRHYFKSDEVMPELGGDYGATIWQWDQNQDPPKP